MISEFINIPESVADFIERRVPTKIGARHYTKLLRQADGYYSRYAEYITKLRHSSSPLQVKKCPIMKSTALTV
jgi:intergrase/recombinase